MIIGDGLLGTSFKKSYLNFDKCIVMCSGVSSSEETNELEFEREIDLVNSFQGQSDLKFIYFSSILADIGNTPYYNHKLKVENLIRDNFKSYLIIRVPQIIGLSGNPNNLVNHIKNRIKTGEVVTVYKDVKRALLDVDDLVSFVYWFSQVRENETLVISHIEKVDSLELVKMIGEVLDITPKIVVVDSKLFNWDIENSALTNKIISTFGLDEPEYTKKLIKKYIV